jgi:AcrR family transcriptional regulator
VQEASPQNRRPRSRRKDARPAEIAAAALALFAERGFAATRLEDVAAAAGIGKGTIYLYFANKEELFEAVVRQQLLPRLDAAEAMLDAYTGSVADLARGFVEIAAEAIASDLTAIPKLVVTEAGNFPVMARFYADAVVKRGVAILARVLALGVARGEFRPVDPKAILPVFVGPIMMLVLWKHSLGRHSDIQFSPRQVLEAHVETFLRGLRPEDAR